MVFVSDFADQAVMLPLAGVVLATLASVGWWRGAGAWLVAVCGTFATIAVLKAGAITMQATFGSDYASSPSGHVASACVVYGGMAVLLLRGAVPGFVIAGIPIVLLGVIGYSRVSLGMHTPADVLIGGIVGVGGLASLAALMGPRPRLSLWSVTAAGGMTVLALHGLHMPAEEAIQFAARSWY